MINITNAPEVPMGFSMALAQNLPAMGYFASQSPEQQRHIIQKTQHIGSKEEMQRFVASLMSGN